MMTMTEREAWITLTQAWSDVSMSIAPKAVCTDLVERADMPLHAWTRVNAIPDGLLPDEAIDRFLVLCVYAVAVVQRAHLQDAIADAGTDRSAFLQHALAELEARAIAMRESPAYQRAALLHALPIGIRSNGGTS